MPPGHEPPHRPPHGHHHPTWFENEERERPLQEIGERIRQIGEYLAEHGAIRLGSSKVVPADPSWLILRYERSPRGALVLKIEVEWPENTEAAATDPPGGELELAPPDRG